MVTAVFGPSCKSWIPCNYSRSTNLITPANLRAPVIHAPPECVDHSKFSANLVLPGELYFHRDYMNLNFMSRCPHCERIMRVGSLEYDSNLDILFKRCRNPVCDEAVYTVRTAHTGYKRKEEMTAEEARDWTILMRFS